MPKAPLSNDLQPKPDRNCSKTVWDPSTRYKVLLEVNNAIINQTSRENLFQSIASEIRKIFPFDRFSINIYEPDSNSLSWFAMAEGITVKSMDDSSRSLDKGPVARAVLTSRQPLVIPDMSQYSHWQTVRLMMDAGLRATMAFPLIVRGNVVGSLHFSFKDPPVMIEELAGFLMELSGQVALAVDNMLSHTQLMNLNASLEQQKRYLLKQVDPQYNPDNFYFSSPAMQEIMRQVEIIADSDASILITGETGTGKDCVARYLHYLSGRRDALFVKVNCPALSPSLFESELFGHVKGAFTGAYAKRVGRFEMANGGTIFLDEIGELPMPLQAKLLHVLQDRRFERVGDSRSVDVNFRVIAASNVDLQAAIRAKNFRSDLYYRLNMVSFHLPPLRERVEEIEPLVRQLTKSQAESMRRTPPTYAAEVMDLMKRHPWPGNVRELKNIISRLIIVFSGKTVTRGDIEPLLNLQQSETCGTLVTLEELERTHLIKVMSLTKGVVGGKHGAAAILKMPKSTLQYRLRLYGINPHKFTQ
jgi:transcriptional regulator with GAF, ATPase, and Fis domain